MDGNREVINNKLNIAEKIKKETYITNEGYNIIILNYNGSKDVDIMFDDEFKFVTNVYFSSIKRGQLRNPYHKSIFGVGYFGVGDYKANIKGKPSKMYYSWVNMLKRCYSEEYQSNSPSYKGCWVCDEWHNFQKFAKWYDENYYEIEGKRMCLDKDILLKRNKLYSPETCVFVPDCINNIFVKKQNFRGGYLIGISLEKGKYRVRVKNPITKKRISCGVFNTQVEAFKEYKKAKEFFIKELADKYKSKIPQKLYDAMYKYEVEITD